MSVLYCCVKNTPNRSDFKQQWSWSCFALFCFAPHEPVPCAAFCEDSWSRFHVGSAGAAQPGAGSSSRNWNMAQAWLASWWSSGRAIDHGPQCLLHGFQGFKSKYPERQAGSCGSCHCFQTSPRRGASSLAARVTGRAVSTSMSKQEGPNPLLNGKHISSFGASSLKPHCHPHTILIGHALLSVRPSSLNTESALRDLAPQLVRETFVEGKLFPSVAAASSAVKSGRRQAGPDGHLLQFRNMLCAWDGGSQLPCILSPTSPSGHMK